MNTNRAQRLQRAEQFYNRQSYCQCAAVTASAQEYTGYAAKYYRSAEQEARRRPLSKREVYEKRLARRRAALVRKLIFALVGASIIFFFGICLGTTRAGAASKPLYKYYTSVTIEKGDTIWDLADEYIFGYDIDKRDYVEEICQLNGIPNGEIHVGDVITMYYYSSDVK